MNARMVRLTVTLDASSTRCAQDLLDALRFLIPATQLDPGCVRCTAWSDPNLVVTYTEEWASEAHVRRRICSESFTLLLSILETAKNPRVRFDFVTASRGLDYVFELRTDAVDYEARAY